MVINGVYREERVFVRDRCWIRVKNSDGFKILLDKVRLGFRFCS